MASEVDIANLALSHLGDSATVTSLSPPEGSAQAGHCARFYPIARDSLLEMHQWNFAIKRVQLALLTATNDQWVYVYALPSGCLNAMAVLAYDATDDNNPQDFQIETLSDGTMVILTNQESAVLRYKAKITDTTKFLPLFVTALSHTLASMLAGPILKGDVGRNEAKQQLAMANIFISKAALSDANQRQVRVEQTVPWFSEYDTTTEVTNA